MLLFIRPCHHHRFRAVLNDAVRLRRETVQADREPDASDDEAASYLVKLDAAGRVIASVRAMPATACNLDCDRLEHGMESAMPRGAHVVEISRLCVAPELQGEQRLRAVLELRAGMAQLFGLHGWTQGVVVGHDDHIQPFIRSGMKVQALGLPVVLPGDSRLSFAVLASDPGRPGRAAELLAGSHPRLLDPHEDPSLFTRYGDRAVA
ncbi:MAG TPA: acyl-homoserine-lactone synthase [Caulobacteraceae bacterium]